MNPDIASIHDRMAQGGNWRKFRDEIAALHNEAATEEEFVMLLEAHSNLVAVGPHAHDAETWAKLLPITRGEYLNFLNQEALEDGNINPVLLDRVTKREIAAGRMAPYNEFASFAAAGAAVLGDSAELTAHACRNGNYFFYGMAVAGIVAFVLPYVHFSPLWLIVLGLLIGWYLNDRERKRIKAEIAARRA
ncbi:MULTISPECIES: hypothetical protein [unclassified Sphingomonas]|uniref:hypothetical protein n=1 Tax=unclassified Sphingomonas TaxID=196159 RepID=UPI000BC8590A|nr:MAG: hypothetical protein B7Z43_11700 [Sphingomonas sp. 12-62-6]OYX39027.1 MAG: hypothetical protein B7Y98_06240 [Sphingomonas sp. 32-62-10]